MGMKFYVGCAFSRSKGEGSLLGTKAALPFQVLINTIFLKIKLLVLSYQHLNSKELHRGRNVHIVQELEGPLWQNKYICQMKAENQVQMEQKKDATLTEIFHAIYWAQGIYKAIKFRISRCCHWQPRLMTHSNMCKWCTLKIRMWADRYGHGNAHNSLFKQCLPNQLGNRL